MSNLDHVMQTKIEICMQNSNVFSRYTENDKNYQTLIKAYLNMPNKKKPVFSRFKKSIQRNGTKTTFCLSSPHRSFKG